MIPCDGMISRIGTNWSVVRQLSGKRIRHQVQGLRSTCETLNNSCKNQIGRIVNEFRKCVDKKKSQIALWRLKVDGIWSQGGVRYRAKKLEKLRRIVPPRTNFLERFVMVQRHWHSGNLTNGVGAYASKNVISGVANSFVWNEHQG